MAPNPARQLAVAIEGEGAFAASNTCLAILRSNSVMVNKGARAASSTTNAAHESSGKGTTSSRAAQSQNSDRASAPEGATSPATPDPNIWFATGGRVSRVFHSPDRGQTWQVADTPILHGPDSAGIFSIAFRDETRGVIAGGDYKHPTQDGPNLAFTTDGGRTWTLSAIHPQAYFSAVAYDRQPANQKAGRIERLFIVGDDFIFDFRPPANPSRISPRKKSGIKFNAVSAYPEGGALIVGPKGAIATLP